MFIFFVSLGVLARNKDFQILALGITMVPRFVPSSPSFIAKQVLKKIYGVFFFNFVNISSIVFIGFYCKIRFAC